jgi:hypothetical protein
VFVREIVRSAAPLVRAIDAGAGMDHERGGRPGTMKARVEHRRAHLRFEVLGTMSASVVATQQLQVVNLGVSGALVESAIQLPPNAEYRMQLVLETHVCEVTVKVRRVVSIRDEQGSPRYQIGLEFLTVSQETADVIGQMILANQAQV